MDLKGCKRNIQSNKMILIQKVKESKMKIVYEKVKCTYGNM